MLWSLHFQHDGILIKIKNEVLKYTSMLAYKGSFKLLFMFSTLKCYVQVLDSGQILLELLYYYTCRSMTVLHKCLS